MATEVKQVQQATPKSTEEKLVERSQQFWSRNSKFIVYALTALILLVGGYFIYNNYFQQPAEQKANEAIWKAEQYYRMDSFRLALNGDGIHPGFLRVISRFGGTKAANLAEFYSGVCYVQLGDFNNAVKHLKNFSTDESEVKLRATGLLGDAYSELGQNEKAVENYKKAGTMFEEDDVNSSEYLFRAGYLYEKMGKTKEAAEMYKMVKQKYPLSTRATDVDKYLGRLGVFDVDK